MDKGLMLRLAAASLALSALLGGSAGGQALPPDDSPTASKVDPQVLDALAVEPWVDVFVALDAPDAGAGPQALAPLRLQVAEGQSDVLSALAPGDFRLLHRYQGIASLFGRASAAGVDKLARHPRVVRVYRPPQLEYTLTQSVPLVNADHAHAAGYTGAGAVAAPLDSGIDTDHSDLQDDLVGQHCFADPPFSCPGGGSEAHGPGSAEDTNGHGTHVSGIISSGGVVAPTGVAPDAGLIVFRVGTGTGISTSGALKALDYIITHPGDGIRVINMSFGGGAFTPPCDAFFPDWASALTTLRGAGVIAFAAAGNGGDKGKLLFPACVSPAVSVGATYDASSGPFTWCLNPPLCTSRCTDTSAADKVTCFSNSHASIDLLAPGSVILSSSLNNTAANRSGTSMASPHAAGVAALMLGADPLATPAQVEACLKSSGLPLTDTANGVTTPRVDAAAALNCIGAGPVCFGGIGNGRGIPLNDETDPAFIAGDCDNDGLPDAAELTGAACGGTVTDPGPDITYDDDNDGLPNLGSLGGTDAADDPPAWDTDGDGVRDGFECGNGFDPTSPASRPSAAQCGGSGDADGDGLLDGWERCKWGTNPALLDSDGDTLGDCREAADVDGSGTVDFVGDTVYYAKAVLMPPAAFGRDGDFDINGDNVLDFVADIIFAAKFALVSGLCK